MKLSEYWLELYGGDFAEGVQLVKKHAAQYVTNNILRRLNEVVNTGEEPGDYLRGKVLHALEQCTIEGDAPPAKKPSAPTAPTEQRESPTIQQATTSARAKALHKEHAHVHASMVNAKTDEERGALAHEIMGTIVPDLDAEYDSLRGNTAATEAMQDISKATTGDLRKLNSLRTRIARIRKHLLPKEKDPKRRAKLEAELAEKTTQKEQIEASL
jgi:hypothetical protein